MISMSTKRAQSRGFSLVEMIAALAIVSIVSLALFQSTSQWLRLSARASDAAERSVADAIGLSRFQHVVRGLAIGWPEEGAAFAGDGGGFSGLTRSPLDAAEPGLVAFAIRRARAATTGQSDVLYESGAAGWVIAEGDGAELAFHYLASDGRWRPTWPPSEAPRPGPNQDTQLLDIPPLPLAVRLVRSYPDGARAVWLAPVGDDVAPRLRNSDFIGGDDDR